MNNNRVFINEEGIIEICVVGDQTVESAQETCDKALELAREQRASGKPALILDSLLEIGNAPSEARNLVVHILKSDDYDRFAMLGADSILRLGANLRLQATGKGNRVKYFEDRDSSIAWLLNNDAAADTTSDSTTVQ